MGKVINYTSEQVQEITSNLNTAVQKRNLFHNSLSTREFDAFIKESCKGFPYSQRSYVSFFLAESSKDNPYVELDNSIRLPGKGSKECYYFFRKPIPWRVIFRIIQQIKKSNKNYKENKKSSTSSRYSIEDIVNHLEGKGCKITSPDPISFSSKREGIKFLLEHGYVVEKSVVKTMSTSDIESLT